MDALQPPDGETTDIHLFPSDPLALWLTGCVSQYHNRLVAQQHEDAEWKFCDAYEQAAANHTFQTDPHHGWTQSDGYNAIASLGHDTALVCYDRMGVSQGPCKRQPSLSRLDFRG